MCKNKHQAYAQTEHTVVFLLRFAIVRFSTSNTQTQTTKHRVLAKAPTDQTMQNSRWVCRHLTHVQNHVNILYFMQSRICYKRIRNDNGERVY